MFHGSQTVVSSQFSKYKVYISKKWTVKVDSESGQWKWTTNGVSFASENWNLRHSWVLHSLSWKGFSSQNFPPCCGLGLLHIRRRLFLPPPHSLVHLDHWLHTAQAPSMGSFTGSGSLIELLELRSARHKKLSSHPSRPSLAYHWIHCCPFLGPSADQLKKCKKTKYRNKT